MMGWTFSHSYIYINIKRWSGSLFLIYTYLCVNTSAQLQNSAVCRADLFGSFDYADLNARNSDEYIQTLDPSDPAAQNIVTEFFKQGYIAQGSYDTPQFNYSSERLYELSGSHTPLLFQIGHDTFEVVNEHVQIQQHHSMIFFVVDQNENIVAIFNTTRDFSERETYALGSLIFRVDLSNSDITTLTPFMNCNLHHNWEGHPIDVVDPGSWNRTLSVAVASPHEVCIRNLTQYKGETYFGLQAPTQEELATDVTEDVGYSVFMPPYERVRLSVENGTFILIEMDFRSGMFLGVGFTDPVQNPGNLMSPSDMIVCREYQGEVRCDDYYSKGEAVRDGGPILDTAVSGGTSNLIPVEYSILDGNVRAVMRRPINASDPNLDLRINIKSQNLIFARSRTASMGGLEYHGVLGRLQRFNINLQVATNDISDFAEAQSVRDLQVVHGMMMFVFWGVNIVIGGAIARYYKNTRHWFQIHKFFQLVNTFLTIPIFLLTLGFVPAEARFRTTHGKLGYSIVFLSLFQAFLGNTSHVLNKISKGLLKHCETSETISPEVLEMVEAVKPIPINVVKKRRDFFENWSHRRSMLSERHKDEVDKIVKDYLTKVYFLMSQIPYFLSIISFLVKHVNQNHIRKMHRLLGRIFLLLGITQIALGLRVLKVESSVEIIIWTWISLCLFIIVYKEIERFFQLPLGVYPKLVFGYNSFCGGDWQVPGAQSFLGEQTFDHKHEDKQRRFSKRGSNKPRSENKSANNKKNMEKVNSFDINQDTKDIDTSYMSFGSTEHHRTRLRKNVTEGGYPNDFMERLRQAEAKGAHDDVIELSIQGVEHRPTSMIIDDNDNVDARTKTSFAMTDD